MVTFMFFSAKAGRFKSNVQIRTLRHWNYKKLYTVFHKVFDLIDGFFMYLFSLSPSHQKKVFYRPPSPTWSQAPCKIHFLKTDIFKALKRCSSPNHLYTPFCLPYFLNILVPQGYKAPESTPACFPPCHPMALRTPPRHSSRALRLNQPSHAPKSEQETSWVGGGSCWRNLDTWKDITGHSPFLHCFVDFFFGGEEMFIFYKNRCSFRKITFSCCWWTIHPAKPAIVTNTRWWTGTSDQELATHSYCGTLRAYHLVVLQVLRTLQLG